MHGKKDYLRSRTNDADFSRCVDTVEQRHGDIEENQIGAEFFRERHRGAAVSRFADDLVAAALKQIFNPFPNDLVVVGYENPRFQSIFPWHFDEQRGSFTESGKYLQFSFALFDTLPYARKP
jgi:hypothetical protein